MAAWAKGLDVARYRFISLHGDLCVAVPMNTMEYKAELSRLDHEACDARPFGVEISAPIQSRMFSFRNRFAWLLTNVSGRAQGGGGAASSKTETLEERQARYERELADKK